MRVALMALLMIPLVVGCGDGGDKSGDEKPASADTYIDADNDGVPADQDCDDEDSESTILENDADCDTVLTAEDCDDTDATLGAMDLDGDCDGVPTAQDCDDADGTMSLCWKVLSAGGAHTCGITMDDETICWGNNEYGQASPPSGVAFNALSANWDHTCGVTHTGQVDCWGLNDHGQGSPPEGYSFSTVTTGGSHTCGITTDGETLCWGLNTQGSTEPPEGVELKVLDAGSDTTCGVGGWADAGAEWKDSVICWGVDEWTAGSGIFCGGDTVSHCTDVKTTGYSHTCGLKYTPGGGQNTICKGLNSVGQTDDPYIGWVYAMDVGPENTCRLFKASASSPKDIQCTGAGGYGIHDTPDGHEYTALTMGSWHICALTTENKAICWGDNEYNQASPPHANADAGADSDSEICTDTCEWADDGECDDGGEGSVYDECDYGTDCTDCGPR
jgi:hypothetical protein